MTTPRKLRDTDSVTLQLLALGFTLSSDELPAMGAGVIGYHKCFGFAHGYYGGKESGFILPDPTVRKGGYNWVTAWRYEGTGLGEKH